VVRALLASCLAAPVLAGCTTGTDGSTAPAPTESPARDLTAFPTQDAAAEVQAAQRAWAGSDAGALVPALQRAAASCPDEATAKRLGEVAAVAQRWAQAIEDNRPKVQARTEAQLGEVDWAALATSCASP
jgi:hypothetical protein